MKRFSTLRVSCACLVILSAAALAGCASPRAKLGAGLESAGLSPRMSACMADRMVDRLSLVQLRRIQSLGGLRKVDMERVGMDEFLYRIRALRDPEILEVTSKAALICALD